MSVNVAKPTSCVAPTARTMLALVPEPTDPTNDTWAATNPTMVNAVVTVYVKPLPIVKVRASVITAVVNVATVNPFVPANVTAALGNVNVAEQVSKAFNVNVNAAVNVTLAKVQVALIVQLEAMLRIEAPGVTVPAV